MAKINKSAAKIVSIENTGVMFVMEAGNWVRIMAEGKIVAQVNLVDLQTAVKALTE